MNQQIPELKAHPTDDSSHPGIVGRFTAIHTLPLVHPSERAGEHNLSISIITTPCLTPICHTKSMIEESTKTDKFNSASSKCYSVAWLITMGFDAVTMCCVQARNNHCNDVSASLSIKAKIPIDDGSNPSSTIASQHFFPYPKNEIHHPPAGLHTIHEAN